MVENTQNEVDNLTISVEGKAFHLNFRTIAIGLQFLLLEIIRTPDEVNKRVCKQQNVSIAQLSRFSGEIMIWQNMRESQKDNAVQNT